MQYSFNVLEILLILNFVMSLYSIISIRMIKEKNKLYDVRIENLRKDLFENEINFQKRENSLYDYIRTSISNLNDLIDNRFNNLKKDKPKKENQK